MPDLIRHPELIENTGFRVKPGMTIKANSDYLQSHQITNLKKQINNPPQAEPKIENLQVPMFQDVRYFFCSRVSRSI